MQRKNMAGIGWILLAVFCSMLAEGKNPEDEFGGGLNMLNQLFGGQDNCDGGYKCSNGAQPRPKKNHIPTSDGCGTTMIKVDISQYPDMHECCDKHDKCYDTCNTEKAKCDDKFQRCMTKYCKTFRPSHRKRECGDAANLMYTGTAVFGCEYYLKSQKQACDCSHMPKTSDRLKRDTKEGL